MKFTYSVYKYVKTADGSDIDGRYFVLGNLDFDVAEQLAENLSIIDTQMTELNMCDVSIKYRVLSEHTGRIKKTFSV